MGKIERQFKGIWIPAHIWLDDELTPTEKILLADIDSFTGNGKTFYKSNDTLSNELHASVSTIKRAIKRLTERNHISITGNTRQRLISSNTNKGQIERDKVQIEPNVVQNELSLGSKRPPTNTVTNSTTNSLLTEGVILPFEDCRFKLAWVMWIDERKARRYGRYTPVGEQAALHKLFKESNEDLQIAIEMINASVANGWRGIFPLKNNKNGQSNKTRFDSEEYLNYLKTLV